MDIKDYLKRSGEKVLNLGCGRNKDPNHFGIDIMNHDCVDLVHDLSKGIPIDACSFDKVICIDFLEHTFPKDNIMIMEEIYRVLKFGGRFVFIVPSTDGNNIGAFQDPTHFSFWNQMKFNYFMDDKYGQGFRSIYNINCFFKPLSLLTYNNQWGVTYVNGELEKGVLDVK